MKKLIFILTFLSLSTALFAQLDRSIPPKPQPNPSIKIEIPDPMEFSNGLNVIVVENHKLPVVSFQLFIDYPTPLEGEKAGLRSVYGEMLKAGTANTPKDKFDEEIDYIGASFFTNSRGFYASSLKKHTPKLLTLLKEVLSQPAFTQEDFDRVISQNLSGLASLPSEASAISRNVSDVVNYGSNHPYGEMTTEETLGNITLDDIKDFHKKYFVPNNAYLVIVGDITHNEAKQFTRDYFESWAKGEEIKKKDYVTPKSKGNNVYFVDKPGAVQSVINITHNVKLTPGHPDEVKLRVLNQILGGGSFSARLLSNLREDKAYTYGCYSNIDSDPIIGSFSAGGSFRNEVTDSAIVQILAELERITDLAVTDEELDLVKKSMTGAFARSLESPRTVANFALNTIRYDLPSDYYSNYLKRIEKVTKEELLMVALEYLTPQNVNIIVVGNEEIAEKLAVFDQDGKVDYKDYYGQYKEQLKKPADNVTVKSILDQYLFNYAMVKNQTEFDQKMASVKQIETYAMATIKAYDVDLILYTAKGDPNLSASALYMKSAMGNGIQQTDYFNGTSGGETAMGKFTAYEGEDLEKKKENSFPISQINYLKDPTKTIELLGIIGLNDVDHYKLKITEKEEFSFEYYNVETGMLSMSESFVEDEKGEIVSVITTLENYTEFSGFYLPKNRILNANGQLMDFEVKIFKTNKKIKSKAFSGNFKKIEKILSKLK